VLALVHVRVHVADDRELDVALRVGEQCVGPMSIIWCTAGVSGMDAPAMRASFGLQTPQAMTTMSASTSPSVVRTRRTRPLSTSIPTTSVLADTVSRPDSCPRSRMIVPARRESTTPTDGV
jgi:hypothetical protein